MAAVVVPQPNAQVQSLKSSADQAYAARNFQEAIQLYSEALEIAQDAVVLSNRSAALAQLSRFEKAKADAEKALALEPRWPRLYERLGHAEFHMGRWRQAVDAFEKGLELDPQNSSLQDVLNRAMQYTEEVEGQFEEQPGEEAVSQNGKHSIPQTTSAKASASDAPAERPAAASAPTATAARTATGSRRPGAFSAAAASASSQAARSKDRGDPADSMETGPSAAELREKGNALFREGKYSAAMKTYSASIDANPIDARTWANRAASATAILEDCSQSLDKSELQKNPYYSAALQDLEESLRLDAGYIKAWARKGKLLALVGETHQALAAFEGGLRVDGDSPECIAGKRSCEEELQRTGN